MRWKITLLTMLICLMFGLSASAVDTEAASASKYKIRVNKQQNTVTVYQRKKGEYQPYKAFVCSTGENTPIGTFRIPVRYRWRPLVANTYGQYATRIVGSFLFHSVVYDRPDPSKLFCKEYNKLGKTASHGCIRLTTKDAKWIYDNCPNGTVVEIYNAKNPGPLGKPKAIKIKGKFGYDPTDIWSKKNPYNKKKPKIKGAKNKKIAYASEKYDVLTGIKATNTTGYSAKKWVTYSVKYRKDKSSSYKKVKTVNTCQAGYYRITYKLTDELGRKAKVTVVHQVLPEAIAEPVPTPSPTPSEMPAPTVTPIPTLPTEAPGKVETPNL